MGSVRSSWNPAKKFLFQTIPDDEYRSSHYIVCTYRQVLEFFGGRVVAQYLQKEFSIQLLLAGGVQWHPFIIQLKGKEIFPAPQRYPIPCSFLFLLIFLPFCFVIFLFLFYDHFWDGRGIWCWLFFSLLSSFGFTSPLQQ